jgi:UDP-glucose 4-epimerase
MGASMIDAQTPIRPDTDYGKSKVLAEELISASGCKAAMVRLGGIFGRRGPDHLGLNRAIRAAAEGRPPTVVGTGRALRNYIHVDDAAEALAQAAVSGLTGTHLLAGSQVLSIADMLQAVCDAYLPGTTPVRADGPEAADQVVEVSGALRPSRPFAEALRSEA